jgi:hypothetical protein
MELEPSSLEQQKIDRQKEIDEELDRRVQWAREQDGCFDRHEWHDLPEVGRTLTRAKAFMMYEIHQALCRADSFGLRQTEGRWFRNDLFLLQMCQDVISKRIEELSRVERAEAFNPRNENKS